MTSRHRRALLVGVVAGLLAWPAAAAPAPTPPPTPKPSPTGTAAPVTITMTMEEYRFTPGTIALRSGGLVRLEIRNQGTVPHEFRSRIFRGVDVFALSPGVTTRSERLEVIFVRPGATALIEFRRRTPGEYIFWCGATVDGRRHQDLGMQGKFIVAP